MCTEDGIPDRKDTKLCSHDESHSNARQEAVDATNLHPGVKSLLDWFSYDHLTSGQVREMSRQFANFAEWAVLFADINDPEVTAGLRKLLEAKDCFVRAKVKATLWD